MRDNKGITLIALVVTIIVLLILTGIVLQLSFGNNGILFKAEFAKEEQIKAEIKEEIEIGITDIFIETAEEDVSDAQRKQNVIEKIAQKVNEVIIINEDLTGEYRGYYYYIDENYEVHIGEKSDTIIRINVKAEDIECTSVTIPVEATSKEGNIMQYEYYINGEKKHETQEPSYTITTLEPGTNYKVKVAVKDEKNNEKVSKEIEVKTKEGLSLYNKGNEYVEKTGGWTANRYCSKLDDKFYYSSLPDTGWNGARANNAIDLTDYSKLCIRLNPENTATVMAIVNDAPFVHSIIADGYSDTGIIRVDISAVTGSHYVWFYSVHKGALLSVDSVWLER